MTRTGVFVALLFAAVALALVLRLPALETRPMHVDEAVHTWKFNTLWQTGEYIYDLREYHGPTLYYAALPVVWLTGVRNLGETEATHFRLVPLVFGVGLILLLPLLADGLGRAAVVVAAFLTAISPAFVCYSPYYIQEMLFVFFTLLAITAGWRFARTGRWAWSVVAGAAVGLMHATKETCTIALACMLVALLLTRAWPRRKQRMYVALGLLVAVAVSVAFFSAFFTNPAGPLDSIRAYATYFDRAGGNGVHEHPWHYYLRMLTFWQTQPGGPIWSEGLITALAAVGFIIAVRGKPLGSTDPHLARFLAVYAALMLLTYSVISYKTPWCLLGPLHALVLLAGVGATALVRVVHFRSAQIALAIILVLAAGQLAWQAHRAVGARFATYHGNPYVYATTLRSVVDLANLIEQIAAAHPAGHELLIKVMVDNPWPLPWYLRRFHRVGYWDHVPDSPDADVILASYQRTNELDARLRQKYQQNVRGLRRDEQLVVYVEQELWDLYVARMQAQ